MLPEPVACEKALPAKRNKMTPRRTVTGKLAALIVVRYLAARERADRACICLLPRKNVCIPFPNISMKPPRDDDGSPSPLTRRSGLSHLFTELPDVRKRRGWDNVDNDVIIASGTHIRR